MKSMLAAGAFACALASPAGAAVFETVCQPSTRPHDPPYTVMWDDTSNALVVNTGRRLVLDDTVERTVRDSQHVNVIGHTHTGTRIVVVFATPLAWQEPAAPAESVRSLDEDGNVIVDTCGMAE